MQLEKNTQLFPILVHCWESLI